jgi:hypothetical protein
VTQLVPGAAAQIDVTYTFGSSSYVGYLAIWADFDGNGSFADAGDVLLPETVVGPGLLGANTISYYPTVPGSAATGPTFIRVRFCDTPMVPCCDFYWYGEVEDYLVWVGEEENLDYGDAPDPSYPTLSASNGACHGLGSGVYLGTAVDQDSDGQPDSSATGDDTDGDGDDEDGVVFTSPLAPGHQTSVDITASTSGKLDGWVDFNDDGDWGDAGEQVFTSQSLTAGVNHLVFNVPADASAGHDTFARFRFSSAGGLHVTGMAVDGEVEDYKVTIESLDWGDAPDPTYPTLCANDGACHVIATGMYLGTAIDRDTDGQPDATATGDDIDSDGDDEDGVVFTSPLVPGQQTTLDVTASVAGYLDAWVDFYDNGDWDDTGEQVFASEALSSGVNHLSFSVPGDATIDDVTIARFRYSSAGGLSYDGLADDGEVEDYGVEAWEETDIDLETGWNMVSVPITAPDMSTGAIFPGVDAVYTWDPGSKSYTVPTTIESEKGYWVAVSTGKTITVTGVPVTEWTDSLSTGWNMIGSVHGGTVAFSSPDDDPDGSCEGFCYCWNCSTKCYDYGTSIETGKGYWAACTAACDLTVGPATP